MNMRPMTVKEKAADRGSRRSRAAILAFGQELRSARVGLGLAQSHVAAAVGMSAAHVSRIESGMVPRLSFHHACRLAAVVGLDLSIRTYPSGSPIRDAAHRALLDRARAALPAVGKWHYEVPLPVPDDQRSWDAVLEIGPGRVSFEAETHLADLQALQRKMMLKRRDDPSIAAAVLVVANTRHNRLVLLEHGEAIRADYPLDLPSLAKTLGAGRLPPANGVIVV
jgi:transcriptional regulator with XRE-family HTH domain